MVVSQHFQEKLIAFLSLYFSAKHLVYIYWYRANIVARAFHVYLFPSICLSKLNKFIVKASCFPQNVFIIILKTRHFKNRFHCPLIQYIRIKGEFIIQPCDSHKKIAPNNYKSVEVYLKYTAKLLYF